MKILYLKKNMHNKNNNALMNYKNITYYIFENENTLEHCDLTQFDCVYSPSIPIDVSKYPNTKFIFGPHFSVFPVKNQMDTIRGNNVIYIQPSDWVRNIWKYNPICDNIKIEILPFAVDTNKFNEIKPIQQRSKVFIYFKRRMPNELKIICDFLKNQGVNDPIVFNYVTGYNEDNYIEYLHNSKFGIWLDAHESQGFALQEALACNVPLLVWNVTSMNQEYGSNYENIPASTIPYWGDNCGEYFVNVKELENIYNKFMCNIENYKPREFIVETLSVEVCENNLIQTISNI